MIHFNLDDLTYWVWCRNLYFHDPFVVFLHNICRVKVTAVAKLISGIQMRTFYIKWLLDNHLKKICRTGFSMTPCFTQTWVWYEVWIGMWFHKSSIWIVNHYKSYIKKVTRVNLSMLQECTYTNWFQGLQP